MTTRNIITIATFNKGKCDFSHERNLYAPVALKTEALEKFQACVQAQYYVWTMEEALEKKEELLTEHPSLKNIGSNGLDNLYEEVEQLQGVEETIATTYATLLVKIKVYENYKTLLQMSPNTYNNLVLDAISKASSLGGFDAGTDKTYILFYASFISGRHKTFLDKEYERIHQLAKILFFNYFLTDEPDNSIHKDKYFKELKDDLVTWYNRHFGLNEGEETELFTAKGSRIAKVPASDIKVFIAGMKGNSKIDNSTGKVKNASFKSKGQGGNEFKLFMLRKVQRISLDEEKALYDMLTAPKEVEAQEPVNNVAEEETKPKAKKVAPKEETKPEAKNVETIDAKEEPVKEETSKTQETPDYNTMSVKEIKEHAKNLGVKGYTKMKKEQLVEACTKATNKEEATK